MKRRRFIQQTAATSAFIGMGGLSISCSEEKRKHITILHTNDVHSHIEPFSPDDPRNPNMGGVARRATLIQQIRAENPNTLLLDAGDIFQGTPFFNFYGGELEFKLMSKLRYDAATIGNHDFDNGINGLFAQLPHADFEFISSNYDFRNTVLAPHVRTHQVFSRDGVRIGVFGLGIELEGLVNPNLYRETEYLDPIEIATDMSRILKEEKKCDIVICLSHLGHSYRSDKISDVKLATATQDIDLIIGGHTHTFLEKPEIYINKAGKQVLVNQVGCFGLYLGRIDFYLDSAKNMETEGVSITV